jgi:TRAP-type C4-dicarboxylate transport system permease small subunit
LHKASALWARIELFAAALLAAAITLLILLNVVTRAFGRAIYWVDEAAIYTMAWMTFLAGSAAVHYGNAVAVTLLEDVAGPVDGAAAACLQGPLRSGLRPAHGLVRAGAGTCR